MSEREYRGWLEWLDRELNRPDRTDHYLMLVAREVRQKLNSRLVSLDEMRIPFERKQEKEVDVAAVTAMAKAVVLGRLGCPVTEVRIPRSRLAS